MFIIRSQKIHTLFTPYSNYLINSSKAHSSTLKVYIITLGINMHGLRGSCPFKVTLVTICCTPKGIIYAYFSWQYTK